MGAAAQAEARLSSLASRSSHLARQGVDTATAAIRIVSDLTAQELSMVIGMVRERMSLRPAASIIGMGGRAITGVVGAQKILLDLAAAETTIAVEGIKQALGFRTAAAAIADLVPRGVGTYVDLSKRVLDDTVEQTQDFVENYADGKPLMVRDKMKKFARQEVEAFVETQKKFLDQVNEQVTIATEEGSEEAIPAERYRPNRLLHLTREGVDKFIDAERKLAHLAIAHIESARPRERKAPRTSFSELAQKSVQNITTAQKSLLDLAMNPMTEDDEPRPRRQAAEPRKAAQPRKAAPRRKRAAAKKG